MSVDVLIVEDSAFMRKVFRSVVSEFAVDEVWVAADGGEGLAICEERRPGLILLDVVMDEMSGLEMLAELEDRPYDPAVIVVTAAKQESVVAEAKQYGVAAVFEKPFDDQALRDAIKDVLGAVNDG